jgi:chaperone required for assembly of F1-ATPase
LKRFWTDASVAVQGSVHTIELDGRPMRLPGGPLLRLRQRALAEAIAAEWQAAGGQKDGLFDASDVPLTGLAGTAQDRIAPNPHPVIDAIAAYGATDLLCYRAERPDALVVRQQREWQPWLDWAAAAYGARLVVTSGVMPVPQDQGALAALRSALAAHDPFALAGLGVLVPAYGSLVLGLAVAAGRLEAEAAHRLSILDELFEEELWGEDSEASARRAHVARDMRDAARFLRLAALA